MSITDAAIQKGNVDERNLFVYGCSGVGILTSWIVTQTDRFAAASAECAIVEWLSVVGTTDLPELRRMLTFTKEPWEDPQQYLKRSPLMYVQNVKTPTILITAERDLGTPLSQAEQFYRALRVLGVDTALVRLQTGHHGYFTGKSDWLETIEYRQQWFNRYKR